MNTEAIAKRLVKLCREQKFEEAQRELYAGDAVSIEPHATPAFEQETKGLVAIIDKGRKFTGGIEKMNRIEVSDPVVAGNSFACSMRLDLKMKGQDPMDMSELCVYQVRDGKIVSEQFFV